MSALGLTVPFWWTPAVSVLSLSIVLLLGSPERASQLTAVAVTVVPSVIVGLLAGSLVVLLARRTPLKAWCVFFASGVIGVLASLALVGAVDVLPDLLQSAGTWAFVAGTAAFPVVAQMVRKRGA